MATKEVDSSKDMETMRATLEELFKSQENLHKETEALKEIVTALKEVQKAQEMTYHEDLVNNLFVELFQSSEVDSTYEEGIQFFQNNQQYQVTRIKESGGKDNPFQDSELRCDQHLQELMESLGVCHPLMTEEEQLQDPELERGQHIKELVESLRGPQQYSIFDNEDQFQDSLFEFSQNYLVNHSTNICFTQIDTIINDLEGCHEDKDNSIINKHAQSCTEVLLMPSTFNVNTTQRPIQEFCVEHQEKFSLGPTKDGEVQSDHEFKDWKSVLLPTLKILDCKLGKQAEINFQEDSWQDRNWVLLGGMNNNHANLIDRNMFIGTSDGKNNAGDCCTTIERAANLVKNVFWKETYHVYRLFVVDVEVIFWEWKGGTSGLIWEEFEEQWSLLTCHKLSIHGLLGSAGILLELVPIKKIIFSIDGYESTELNADGKVSISLGISRVDLMKIENGAFEFEQQRNESIELVQNAWFEFVFVLLEFEAEVTCKIGLISSKDGWSYTVVVDGRKQTGFHIIHNCSSPLQAFIMAADKCDMTTNLFRDYFHFQLLSLGTKLHSMTIVNDSSSFTQLWHVLHKVLDAKISAKLQVLEPKSSSTLLGIIDFSLLHFLCENLVVILVMCRDCDVPWDPGENIMSWLFPTLEDKSSLREGVLLCT